MKIHKNSRNNFYIRCINYFHMSCTKNSTRVLHDDGKSSIYKLICIYLERHNLFNLADNSGVSMEKTVNLRTSKVGRRMGRKMSSFSIFTSAPLRIHGSLVKQNIHCHDITSRCRWTTAAGNVFEQSLGMKFERTSLEPQSVSSTRADNSREITWNRLIVVLSLA